MPRWHRWGIERIGGYRRIKKRRARCSLRHVCRTNSSSLSHSLPIKKIHAKTNTAEEQKERRRKKIVRYGRAADTRRLRFAEVASVGRRTHRWLPPHQTKMPQDAHFGACRSSPLSPSLRAQSAQKSRHKEIAEALTQHQWKHLPASTIPLKPLRFSQSTISVPHKERDCVHGRCRFIGNISAVETSSKAAPMQPISLFA